MIRSIAFIDWQGKLPLRFKLSDHTLDLDRLSTICLLAEQFQGIHVLCLERFFARTGNHAALHPHIDALGWLEAGAFGDECGGECFVAGAEDFVVEWLQ
jgi:hypothetical protein